MKVLIVFCFLLSTALHSFAQSDSESLFYLQKAEKYRRMKNTGAVLTVTGGILFVVGIATVANSSVTTTTTGSQTHTTTTGNPEAGAVAFLVGSAGLGAGIPLWIVGSHAEEKYRRKLANVSVRVNMNREASGLMIRYRF